MGAVADGALSKRGKVYGVVPGFLQDLELTHRGLTGLEIVADMRTRKHRMIEESDAVVTLPGGSGTYEELFETLTMKRLGQWLGPVVIVNTNGFYNGLLAFLNHSVEEMFMGQATWICGLSSMNPNRFWMLSGTHAHGKAMRSSSLT